MYLSTTTVLIFLGLIISSSAHNSPHDFLKAHNRARARVGVGPLKWDRNLAHYAQNYAEHRKDCELIHSDGPYGENIAYWSEHPFTAQQAVDLWMDEAQYYDCRTNTCAPDQVCGHYTQIVWRNSTCLGCGSVACDNGGVFITCNYNPPGNYIGERPY